MPTCLRNHSLIEEVKAGKGPIYMHTQAVVWASQNIDPKETPSELITSEPYIMGCHATCSGAWASGPEDCAPQDYQWGYNRMTPNAAAAAALSAAMSAEALTGRACRPRGSAIRDNAT
jgi:succinate dehydrogenase/fumarate reductase flavoprotein subunit